MLWRSIIIMINVSLSEEANGKPYKFVGLPGFDRT